MKTLLKLIGLCMLPIASFGQWTEPVSGVTQDLNDVHFPSATIGYAVGEGGSLIKSEDAGDTWEVLTSGSTASLQGVHFLDENTGFIVGYEIMLKTSDGGDTWTEVTLPISKQFMDVYFIDATVGFCIGQSGTILKTTDAGDSWSIKDADCDRYLSKIHFPSALVGYATSKGYNSNFIKTTDGGETWVDDTIDASLIFGSFEAVYFTDENTGLIGSWYIYGLVKTTDGGANWTDVSGSESPDLYTIDFASSSIGFAGGINGLFMTTLDGGDTWTSETIGDQNILEMQALSATEVICVGSSGYIAKTATATSSIDDYKAIQIEVFPNPSNGEFTVSSSISTDCNYTIYSADGRLINSFQSSENQLSITLNEGQGIYFLEVKNEFGREVIRLVIE